ncbi:c-type cytochrome [Nitrosophilus kaiyonis]|uniref:c-type cytochrome n=1 Tax=Nitrosophilus kaiyonis TaxID=2930200 RepID=UPI002493AE9F|nr:c-type cytochrome [Nitrosophilus kaiyonis]
MKKIFIVLFLLSLFSYADLGEKLYTKHGCYGCHGSNAQGGNGFPKLAGKSSSYLIKKLQGYKYEKINSNRADMMKPFAKNLSQKEIELLAKYLESLKNKKSDEERYYEEFIIGDSSGS